MENVVKTDLLVIGGSLAGLCAAITAKENNSELNVTVVEKYTSGYAGKANRGAGIMDAMAGVDPERYVEYHTRYNGDYLNDQDFLRDYANGLDKSVELLDKWSGGKVSKTHDGGFRYLKWRAQITGKDEYGKLTFDNKDDFPWTLVAVDLDYMVNMRNYAAKAGIKFIDRTGVVDFLKDGERISGAVGYNIDDGSQTVFQCKAVVLATGACNYRIMPMWSGGRGEGIAAAYRAGAQFRNCEFGSFYNWTSLENFESSMGVEYALYNKNGENVCQKYSSGHHSDVDAYSIAEYYKQTKAGNGPLTYRMEENPLMPFLMQCCGSSAYFDRPFADKFWNNLFFNAFSQATNNECVPGLVAEFAGLQVGRDFQSSVPGLFAAGDICHSGGSYHGATTPPVRVRGSGLANAQYSGRLAGENSAAFALGHDFGKIDEAAIQAIDAHFKKPGNQNGTVSVMEFLPEIHNVMQPLGNSLYRSEERLTKALARVKELQEKLPVLKADDPHNLFGCLELESMLICAEMFFTTSLLRKESRGWFLREDYPDKAEEIMWYTCRMGDDGSLTTGSERVPIETYKYQPEA
ncbi:MAG: FAD-binding protein [Lachnospiraceae bacterium]|nr:FAD-binding protein [Lachnospiraceae bacterium]